jgi:Domain of unknown function (DUF4333)
VTHRLLLIPLVALLAASLAGCDFEFSVGGSSIDNEQAAEEISGGLEDAYGEPPESLTCPDDVEPKEGETFTCEGVAPDGRPFQIEVTMTDEEGGIRYPTQVEFTGSAPNA